MKVGRFVFQEYRNGHVRRLLFEDDSVPVGRTIINRNEDVMVTGIAVDRYITIEYL